jgi:hypothetical protein
MRLFAMFSIPYILSPQGQSQPLDEYPQQLCYVILYYIILHGTSINPRQHLCTILFPWNSSRPSFIALAIRNDNPGLEAWQWTFFNRTSFVEMYPALLPLKWSTIRIVHQIWLRTKKEVCARVCCGVSPRVWLVVVWCLMPTSTSLFCAVRSF